MSIRYNYKLQYIVCDDMKVTGDGIKWGMWNLKSSHHPADMALVWDLIQFNAMAV